MQYFVVIQHYKNKESVVLIREARHIGLMMDDLTREILESDGDFPNSISVSGPHNFQPKETV